MKTAALCLSVLLTAVTAKAADEAPTFRGLRFDQSVPQQLSECQRKKVGRVTMYAEPPSATCWEFYAFCIEYDHRPAGLCDAPGQIHFAGQSILPGYASFGEVGGKLGLVTSTLPVSRASEIHSALVERYGQPKREYEEEWASKMGAKTTAKISVWKWHGITVELRGPASKIDEASLSAWSDEWDKSVQKDAEQKRHEAAGSL